jgi:uncharacterized protein YbjT (DUF2867 family)
VTAHVIDFDRLEDETELPRVHDVFCSLGTPMNKLGNHRLLDKVDYHYPIVLAEKALTAGAERFLLVTSAGIGPRSPIYYCRVKVRTERALTALAYQGISIFRPSILVDRQRSDSLVQWLVGRIVRLGAPFFVGWLGPLRPVHGRAVGYAMAVHAMLEETGSRVIESHRIHRMYRDGVPELPREPDLHLSKADIEPNID